MCAAPLSLLKMQRAASRLHSGDSTAAPLGRHYCSAKSCATARLSPKHQIFWFGFCTQIKQHTRRKHPRPTEPVAGRASKLLFCWKNLHDSDLLSDTTACGREMRGLCFTVFCVLKRHETPHKQRVVRLLEVFIVWESATLFHLDQTQPTPLPTTQSPRH